jgi:hypothetical protein
MNEEKLNRPWFRFHLLTAVLMMLAAGGFVWKNTLLDDGCVVFDGSKGFNHYGWPLAINDLEADNFVLHQINSNWQWKGIAGNLVLLVGMLVMISLISESIIRRREARKT